MIIYRLILPPWAQKESPKLKKVLEGKFTNEQIKTYNDLGYNIYYLPNHPSVYKSDSSIDGTNIDVFNWIFVDCDFKDGIYKDKDHFLQALGASGIMPSKIIDSGHGIHAYWKILNLDSTSYLRFQRRLIRLLYTDEAVGQLFQLMRMPGTLNTKHKDNKVECELLYESDTAYTSEEMNKLLPQITIEDEKYCQLHYNRTYNINSEDYHVNYDIPIKFGALLNKSTEIYKIWTEDTDDRSKNDFRLGHLLFANGFSKEEAMSILANSAKALQRSPVHRISYAQNIIEKIWTFELSEDRDKLDLSLSVKEILSRPLDTLKGSSFRCHPRIDNTDYGFRLGQVIGLVAGSGVGKTAFALNMFRWFVQSNPDYCHFFIPLEQPINEIADRWKTMCAHDNSLHDKVHVISNYDASGNFRHLSFDEIKDYIKKYKEIKKVNVGCIVIDHIGALKKEGKNGENQDLMDICHSMKAFAVETNTLLVMQSQSSREKAGIGDLELDKDAAYGTVYFESYCDYLITLWQPLKRCHMEEACPTVIAFKFCKIRHKKVRKDIIQEDVPYYMFFDSETEQMRDMTQDEIKSFNFFLPNATNKRKLDRKSGLVSYKSVLYDTKINNN